MGQGIVVLMPLGLACCCRRELGTQDPPWRRAGDKGLARRTTRLPTARYSRVLTEDVCQAT
jgi:hypothetical protein